MDKFHFACATGESAEAIGAELSAQLPTPSENLNVGFVYGTDSSVPYFGEVVDGLRQNTGIENWCGSVGLGIGTNGQEYYDTSTVAVMLGDFASPDYRMIEPQAIDVSGFIGANSEWLDDAEHYFGVVHADPSNARSPGLIDALAGSIPNGFLVGGITSSNSQHLQVNGGVTSGGVSGVLFSSRVPVVTSHTQGCSPIAQSHLVTRSQENIAIELDGRPALDVLREDVGEVIAKDLQRMAGYIFAALPISGSDTGDYLVRNIIGVDEERKLFAVSELLAEGSELMVCRRDGTTACADLVRMLDDVVRRAGGKARGALYYSCLARGRNQFGQNSEELTMVGDALGDIPLVGFFANGEIFHNRLYAYTGVLTVFC